MMKLILSSQLGRNASAYVDDIVIMSEKEKDHIADLTETFDNMRRNGLKLNPEKCIFGIRKGQLLGCMVSGHTGKPSEDRRITKDAATKQQKGGPKAHGQNSIAEPVHLQGS
jgi:hypothetical protein